jgi:elongation factor G
VALAFKVSHEAHTRKPLVWLRVYSGQISPGDELVRVPAGIPGGGSGIPGGGTPGTAADDGGKRSKGGRSAAGGRGGGGRARRGEAGGQAETVRVVRERVAELLLLHGEEATALPCALSGTICAARGLRNVTTGDTLLLRPKPGCDRLRLPGVPVPPPVFFCAVEAEEAAAEDALDAALAAVCLEDPSVVVTHDNTTGARVKARGRCKRTLPIKREPLVNSAFFSSPPLWVCPHPTPPNPPAYAGQQMLGGMGELHLEVVIQRLKSEWKLPLRTGKMRVAYRESISQASDRLGLFHFHAKR